MHEPDARKIDSLLQAVDPQDYVLHIMDIFHLNLSEDETPSFIKLIRAARHVICISGLIEKEAKARGARSTSLLDCGTTFKMGNHAPFEFPLRVIISGSLWAGHYSKNPALQCLEAAWPILRDRFPKIELHYAGTSYSSLPPSLRSIAKDHGLLGHTAYYELLRTMHIAYLPVSHPSDSVGKYSVPSRLADYFAVGLPVITCTDDETSIATFIRRAPRECAVNIRNEQNLVDAIGRFGSTKESWERASTYAVQFADARLRMDLMRAELFTVLSEKGGKNRGRQDWAEFVTMTM